MDCQDSRTLLDELQEEHESIRGMLAVLDRICDAVSRGDPPPPAILERVLEFFRVIVEELHHAKEEELLFPALDAQGPVDQGGPLCTLFMDYWLNWNPTHEINTQAHDAGIALPIARPPIREILEKRNSLSIPIREHDSGRLAAGLMADAVANYRSSGTLPPGFLPAARGYSNLLRLHIRKENECLFEMARSRLAPELLSSLLERARHIDERVGRDRIERCLRDLAILSEAGT